MASIAIVICASKRRVLRTWNFAKKPPSGGIPA